MRIEYCTAAFLGTVIGTCPPVLMGFFAYGGPWATPAAESALMALVGLLSGALLGPLAYYLQFRVLPSDVCLSRLEWAAPLKGRWLRYFLTPWLALTLFLGGQVLAWALTRVVIQRCPQVLTAFPPAPRSCLGP
jgi:hypothetical protein